MTEWATMQTALVIPPESCHSRVFSTDRCLFVVLRPFDRRTCRPSCLSRMRRDSLHERMLHGSREDYTDKIWQSTESSQFSSCQIFVAMEARIPHESLSERFRTLGRTSSPLLWRGESWALSRVSCRWASGCSTECEICGFEMRVFAQPDQNDLSGLMMQSQWEELAMVNKKDILSLCRVQTFAWPQIQK